MDIPEAALLPGTAGAADATGVRWCADRARLAALRAEWESLLARSAADCVFLSWEWIDCWWRHFGADGDLWVAEIRDADGTLRGIAPLKRRTRKGRLGAYRAIEFIGAGGPALPDHLDFIFERGHEERCLTATMTALEARSAEWDLLVLSELDGAPRAAGDSVGAPAVAAWTASHRRPAHRYRSTVCPYLPLHGTWDELVKSLGGGLRSFLPRKLRGAEKRGVRLVGCEDGDALEEGARELARLHQLRMEETRRGGNFRNPAYTAFHLELMRAFAARGWLDLCFLELDGKRIAGFYGYRYGRTLHWYQLGFDPAFSSLSPGLVVIAMRVRDAMAAGFVELDMLRGRSAFKARWTSRYREGVTFILPARGARGVRAYNSELLALPPPLLLKRFLPAEFFEPLTDAVRRMRRGGRRGGAS